MIVGALVVVITLALALPAGYALARLTGKWGERLAIAIFLTCLVPSTLLFIPMSRIVATGVHVRADPHHLERAADGGGADEPGTGATSTSGAH